MFRCIRRTGTLLAAWACILAIVAAGGCRGHQHARVIQPGQREMVGSHGAGSETFKPLVEEAVAKMLARHCEFPPAMVSYSEHPVVLGPKRICFVGVENKSAEELGDFREQIYQCIDSKMLEGGTFEPVSRRFVEAGLRATRLRPDELFVPSNMQMFTMYMEQHGQPFDYLLYATLTSGTTRDNRDYQRDYLLTLELVDVRTGQYDKQSAEISKGYHHSAISRWSPKNWLP
jgi:hypothetical protein